ncbi:MAG TPA: hypothetical protein VGC18_04700 [Lacisediminihabitans sp.]|uniref:hypothetical protein n=1 Tax=Lacisediminihabitans sp. TaxID=2787631 RepID=UPI002EDA6B9F
MERRVLVRWLVLLVILVAAFVTTVLTLNLTLYSAKGFVGSYLHTLSRGDTDGVLATNGVLRSDQATDELTAPAALEHFDDIHLVSDTGNRDGTHTVVYGYAFGSEKGTTSFHVERSGSLLGLFSSWRFVTSPVSILQVTPQHDAAFTANGLDLVSPAGTGGPDKLLVFVPSRVALGHSSTYLTATTKTVLVDRVGVSVAADVDVRANRAFVREVQKELHTYLADCVTQKVLLPTGCPMGKQIADRIQDDPTWSMVTYPTVTIIPGDQPGSWLVPDTPATAHLVVTVKSIFDGTVSKLDEDVPFTVRYLITFQADGTPLITAQYD